MGVSIVGGTPIVGQFVKENTSKMDDLEVPPWLWKPPRGIRIDNINYQTMVDPKQS